MLRQEKQKLHIENPRNHSDQTVTALRRLLEAGAPLRQDLGRPDFFELDDDERIFYVYISPATGTVIFLATWSRQAELEEVAG